MSSSVLGSKVQHLLDVVAQHRDEKCAAIRANAQAEVKKLLRMASQEAQQQTHLRQLRQSDDEALLDTARVALQAALLQHWQQLSSRQLWCEELVNAAVTTLDGKVWTVEHPADWPMSEHDALRERINSLCGKAPRFQANTDISAGLRICAEGTCMDATLEGLLHDRERIDAELLALCTECAGGGV